MNIQQRLVSCSVGALVINLPGTMALAAAIAIVGSGAAWQAARAQSVPTINARVVATNIPGASAIAQVGTFLNNSEVCSHKIDGSQILFPHPIPTLFVSFIQPGAVLDPIESWSAIGRTSAPRSPPRRVGGLVPVDRPEQARVS